MGEEREIATFVILIKLTDQGASAIKDAPKHMQQAFESTAALGAKVKDFYVTMGEYDYVAIGEGPDDETARPPAPPWPPRAT